MTQSPARPRRAGFAAGIAVLIVAVTLAGCGRRGGLEPPGTTEPATAPGGIAAVPLGGPEPRRPDPTPAPDRPFLLDWLL